MDFDLILEEIGEFGKFQVINYFLVCLPVFFAAANSLSYVFTAAVPEYRCHIHECESLNSSDWLSFAIPPKSIYESDSCFRYSFNDSYSNSIETNENEVCGSQSFTKDLIKCDRWHFTKNERTIVTDWPDELTCKENKWKLAAIGSAHFTGIIIGSALFGLLADKYGRKVIFVVCIILMSTAGIINTLSINPQMFTFFTFLDAVGTSGVSPLAFIIGIEMVGKRKRELTGIVQNYFYALGEAGLGLIAWIKPDWISIQLMISGPPLIFILYYWVLPESVRWLIAKKKYDEAEKIVQEAARTNGRVISDKIVSLLKGDSNHEKRSNEYFSNHKCKYQSSWELLKQMLGSNVMLFRGVILYFTWATCAFVYYGLSLNSVHLFGNKYLNFILISLIEIPGYSLAWFFMNKIGRRMSLAGSLILCGFTCSATIFLTKEMAWANITLSLIGKMGITASFGVIYIYSAEMLPTLIRSGGVGSMSTFARFGALMAPFVPLLSFTHSSIPMLLFGLISVISGTLVWFLPETLNCKLPETVEEAIHISNNSKKVGLHSKLNETI